MKQFYIFCLTLILGINFSLAQNPKIKCYFNQPVNTSVSSGVNANYNTSFKDTLINYINRAKYSIDFCIYNYTYFSGDGFDAIATAVNSAYTRGVVIRWIYNGSSTNSGLPLLNSAIKTLGSPTTSGYGICHNKFVVFDANSSNVNDPYVWTGSFNFSHQQNNSDYNNVIIFQDKPLALAFYNQFNQMWGGTGATPNLSNSKFGTFKTASTVTSFTVNGTPVELYFSPKDNSTTQLQNCINTANYELYFGIYTFTDNNVANAIKSKILGGVNAKGIEDQFSQSYGPYTTLSPTMGANLKVYSGTALYHNKIILVDPLHTSSDPLVGTGSYNWSAAGTSSNDENYVVVHDPFIANQYYQSFCKNFTDVGGSACPALTGIEEFDYGQLSSVVYPAITSSEIFVQLKTAELNFTVEIINSLGQTVFNENYSGTNFIKIGTELFAQGIYYVKIKNGSDFRTQKIIKQN